MTAAQLLQLIFEILKTDIEALKGADISQVQGQNTIGVMLPNGDTFFVTVEV